MRWFWSVTCISLRTMTAWLHCVISIGSSGGWFMFVGVCVCAAYISLSVCVCVCEFVFPPLNSQSQPRQTLFSHYWVSFSFFFSLTYIYRQKTRAFPTVCSLSICLSLTLESAEGRGAKIKNAHRLVQRFTGWVAPGLSYASYTGNKKKKVQLFWHRCFGHKIPTLLFFLFCFHFCFRFARLFLTLSPSHFTPWPLVCVPVQKKGRFVVVLPSHLRCSPLKRHRFSYKLCYCEWVGRGGLKRRGAPCAPTSPCAPFTASECVPSALLRACSAAQLLQHFPQAEIVLFNEHAETAFRPRFFICFPQTRKKKYRGSLEGGEGGEGEEGGVAVSTLRERMFSACLPVAAWEAERTTALGGTGETSSELVWIFFFISPLSPHPLHSVLTPAPLSFLHVICSSFSSHFRLQKAFPSCF